MVKEHVNTYCAVALPNCEARLVSIPVDCWKALKILSVEQRQTLQDVHESVLRQALNIPPKSGEAG